MITIAGVQPTSRELRPVTRGWGGLHWWAGFPLFIPFIGLCALALVSSAYMPDNSGFARVVIAILFGTFGTWLLSQWALHRATFRAMRSAPGGGGLSDWTLTEEEAVFTSALSTARLDWAAVKAVLEEKDRFILLVTPTNNPVLPKRQLSEAQTSAVRSLVEDLVSSGRLGRGVDSPAPASDKA